MKRAGHHPEIDGLRAVAVLAVVCYHALGAPAAGYVGVDVFFVISGYLITGLLLDEHAGTGRIDLVAFYARRVRRIFPAVMALICLVLLAGSSLLSFDEQIRAARSASASAIFAANVFFEFNSGGYFDPTVTRMPLLHLWSLAVEEQFYVLWPALLVVVLSRWPRALRATMVILAVGSLALAEGLMHSVPDAAFYQMPARFWELAAGGLLATVPRQSRLPPWIAPASAAAILVACFVPAARFPGLGAVPVVVAAVGFLWTVHTDNCRSWAVGWLRSPPTVAVGLVSYSLYLWHWPVLAFYRAGAVGDEPVWIRILLCVGALVLAFLSWRYIESPFRRMTARWPMVAVGMTLSAMLALGAAWYGHRLQLQEAAEPRDNPLAVKAENDLPPGWRTCHYQVWSTEFPRASCQATAGNQPGIVFWGDSMAMAWRPLMDEMAKRTGQSAIDYSRDACQPFLDHMPATPHPSDYKCRDWNAKVFAQAAKAGVVVMAARWYGGSADEFREPAFKSSEIRATLVALSPHVRRIVLIGATPELRDDVPHCIRLDKVAQCGVPRARFDAIAAAVAAQLHEAAKGLPNVSYIDPTSFFCDRTTCPAVKQGIALYYDSHHISYSAARAYALGSSPAP